MPQFNIKLLGDFISDERADKLVDGPGYLVVATTMSGLPCVVAPLGSDTFILRARETAVDLARFVRDKEHGSGKLQKAKVLEISELKI